MALSVSVDDAADNQANSQPKGTKMDISTTADRAADILETQGHIKNDWGADGGPRCLGGALNQAAFEVRGNGCKYFDVVNSIDNILGLDGGNDFIDWNNAPERKAEEVIQVLRDVATKHRSDAMTVNGDK